MSIHLIFFGGSMRAKPLGINMLETSAIVEGYQANKVVQMTELA